METQVRDEGLLTCCVITDRPPPFPASAKWGLRQMVLMAFPALTSGSTGVKGLLPLRAHKERKSSTFGSLGTL